MAVRKAIGALLMLACATSHAATIVFDPGSTASLRVVNRIEGLVIATAHIAGTYDVIFSSDAWSSIQAAGGFPIYDLGLSDAERAAVANSVIDEIIGVLNTTDANKVGLVVTGPGLGELNSGVGYLPYADSQGGASALSDRALYAGTTGPWGNSTAASIPKSVGAGGYVFISLTPVPLPASVWLLMTGIGVLAARVRAQSRG
ncbi:MAG: VPLPA-CTERM sorting domain-containing protein [Gammaproteobacteria bacterium]|nr:VPLPA-CTERM sorting domain-containing protein [Gammaproteobacteria bacterium]